MNTPTCAVIWILAAMGFYEILFAAVSFLFLAPNEKNCGVIELRGHMENVEFLVRSALLRTSGTVYIIDRGADCETLQIAMLLSGDYDRAVVLRPCGTVCTVGENIAQ